MGDRDPAKAGVLVHQLVMHTHPTDHEDLSPAEVHDMDFRKVIDSDVIVAIGDFASWGAGKELAWAERLRTPALMRRRPRRRRCHRRCAGFLQRCQASRTSP